MSLGLPRTARVASLILFSFFGLALGECGTIVPHTDYDEGSGGPNFPAANMSDCGVLCVSAGAATCWAAVYSDTGCWFKTSAQTAAGVFNEKCTACWPAGRVPPPAPSPPAPPPPPRYTVTVVSRPNEPVISYLAGSTPWPQSFNPAFVEASAGTGGKRGLLVRSQNCTGWAPGQCIRCNVDADHPIAPWFPGSVLSFAEQRTDGSFETPYLVFAPNASAPVDEDYGTEDPRLTLDKTTGLYHLFYTCYSKANGPRLCHATTRDPTAPIEAAAWTRLGDVFPGAPSGAKSAALLLRASPPHYLIWGAGEIHLAVSNDLVNFTTVNTSYIAVRPDSFDNVLVESGPNPLLLSDGNYIFFHNSANSTYECYNAEHAIIDGADPSVVVERAATPLLSPTHDWELGDAPAECNVGCVVFLEAVAPVDGLVDTFDVWFGGSDAVVGTARVHVQVPAAKNIGAI